MCLRSVAVIYRSDFRGRWGGGVLLLLLENKVRRCTISKPRSEQSVVFGKNCSAALGSIREAFPRWTRLLFGATSALCFPIGSEIGLSQDRIWVRSVPGSWRARNSRFRSLFKELRQRVFPTRGRIFTLLPHTRRHRRWSLLTVNIMSYS